MNQMVKRMVDLLFEDVESSEETRELYDEIMNNCQDHFRDLTDSGLTEDEALSAVMESLSGMQEVLDQYPRKKPGQENVPEGSAGPEAASKAETPIRQSSSWVERLRVDAAARDVTVEPSDGDEILIDCEDRENVLVERDGNTLFIHVRRIADELREEAEQFGDYSRMTSEMNLGDLLNRVGSYVNRAVRSVVSRVNSEISSSGAPIRISVPRRKLAAVEINASSGDLEVGGVCAAEFVLRTASGDILLNPDAKEAADRIFASTASGDVEIRDAWARTGEFSSISGDVDLSGDFGDLNCKSVSGEVDFRGTAVDLHSKSVSGAVDLCMKVASSGTITAESTSGSVTVQLPEDAAPAHLVMSSVSGNLRSSVEDAGESAPLKIRLKTVSGAVKVI